MVFVAIYLCGYLLSLLINCKEWWLMDVCLIRLVCRVDYHAQRSVLGPLLSIFYVNDVPDLIESSTKMFANDTKIYSVIRCFYESLKLQRDPDRLNH